jgi:hypothetical protein
MTNWVRIVAVVYYCRLALVPRTVFPGARLLVNHARQVWQLCLCLMENKATSKNDMMEITGFLPLVLQTIFDQVWAPYFQ